MVIDMDSYENVASLMRALAHPLRLQILALLAIKPAYVYDLVDLTKCRQANISQQLAILRESKLVDYSREGYKVRYYLLKPSVIKILEVAGKCGVSIPPDLQDNTSKKQPLGKLWYGIPRKQVQWQPRLLVDKCVGCGLCVISCLKEVFGFNFAQNHPVVISSDLCTVGCKICATVCIHDAIEFPPEDQIRQLISQEKLLRKASNLLNDRREKYDIKRFKSIAG
jgi:DNA-binding transcriptional ArsR family regulator/Pyruvate/2-oxoacid:ferredoxin oxidoreductase delta subunit